MKKHPFLYLVIGIAILVIPTTIYLIFLVPKMTEECRILTASAGIIGSGGLYGANLIPEKWAFSKLYKLACRSYTLLVTISIIEKFVKELILLLTVIVTSYIIFYIFKELWKNARRKIHDEQLASQIARSFNETSK